MATLKERYKFDQHAVLSGMMNVIRNQESTVIHIQAPQEIFQRWESPFVLGGITFNVSLNEELENEITFSHGIESIQFV